MEQAIATWAATVLSAKIFADLIRKEYGFRTPNALAWSRDPVEVDVMYIAILAACTAVVANVGVTAVLPIAIMVRVGQLASVRVLISANHAFLELFILVTFLRLLDRPYALASVIQLLTLSVWLYSVYQKLYHRHFRDGAFFYLAFQRPSLGNRWGRFMGKVGKVEGHFAPIDPAGLAFCRRLALLVLLTEGVTPIVAMFASGSVWSLLVLSVVSLPVGIMTKETNFMLTNLVLGAFFLVPFDPAAVVSIGNDPVATAIVVWCLLWPPFHAFMTRRLRFSTWKLAGWGMYATSYPRLHIVTPGGELVAARGNPGTPFALLLVAGASRIRWLREYAMRSYLKWNYKEPAAGVVFRWHHRRGDRFITTCVVVPNAPGATPLELEIDNEKSEAELTRHLASLRPPSPTPVTDLATVTPMPQSPA